MLNRRDLLKSLTATATLLQLPAAEPNAPLFFNKEEFATLDALTEMIVPADDHSPGAHEAGVAAYIDRTVAESFLPEEKSSWRKGLVTVNELSRSSSGKPFLQSTKQQQLEVMKKMAAGEKDPKTEGERFFTQLKQTTAFAYYSSKIGIHQEMNYKGNVPINQFVGYDAD